jgi:hypothetical protein
VSCKWVVLGLVIAAAAGCGDDNGSTGPNTGTVEIVTATSGNPGMDFTVLVDGSSPRAIAATATLSIPDVPVGVHLIQLTVPANCSFEGDNPRSINVTENAITTVTFTITCGPPGTALR